MGIFDIFSSDNADEARDKQVAGLEKGYARAGDALRQGREALTTNYTAGLQPFTQNYDTSYNQYQQGSTAWANALGLNGQSGYDQAVSQFQNSPGYQSALDAANENTYRNASRTGDLRSGKTNVDLSNNAQNLQNQQWNNYTNQLASYSGQGQQGSTSAAGGIGSLYSGLGNQLAANYGNLAGLGYSTETGIGNAEANAALASNAASGNMVNALMNIAGLASSAFGLSDERAKENIELIGETFDGQPLYRFKYKGDPGGQTHIGPMAQEVEQKTPDAVQEKDGLKYVDYGRATNYAADLAKLLEVA